MAWPWDAQRHCKLPAVNAVRDGSVEVTIHPDILTSSLSCFLSWPRSSSTWMSPEVDDCCQTTIKCVCKPSNKNAHQDFPLNSGSFGGFGRKVGHRCVNRSAATTAYIITGDTSVYANVCTPEQFTKLLVIKFRHLVSLEHVVHCPASLHNTNVIQVGIFTVLANAIGMVLKRMRFGHGNIFIRLPLLPCNDVNTSGS